jgi:hypothetical protein
MHKLKYIRFITSLADSVFLFPTWENHASVALRLGYVPLSAGFVSIQVNADHELVVQTYGRSESLHMESDPADAALIKHMLKTA